MEAITGNMITIGQPDHIITLSSVVRQVFCSSSYIWDQKPSVTQSVIAMETLLALVSFCQKPNILIFNPLK